MHFGKVSGLLIIFYLTYCDFVAKEAFSPRRMVLDEVDCLPQLLLLFLWKVFIGNSKNTFQDVIVMGKNTVAAKTILLK
jgi:hypothetical protein